MQNELEQVLLDTQKEYAKSQTKEFYETVCCVFMKRENSLITV